MKYSFILRIYQDTVNSPALSQFDNITISNITLVSKNTKFGGFCTHKGNRKKFKYSLELSKPFNAVSGSHSSPSLTFKGEYIDLIVNDFPRYPVFAQLDAAAKGCLNGYGYINYLNKGFPHQLLYRQVEILTIKALNSIETSSGLSSPD